MRLYIGTISRFGGKGIFTLEEKDGVFTQLDVCDAISDPIWLTLSRSGSRLFVSGADLSRTENNGLVAEFSTEDAKLELVAVQAVGSSGICHLCLSPDERFLYSASYGNGSINVFPVEKTLQEPVQTLVHPSTQPRVHQVSFIPGTSFLAAVDLGGNTIFVYQAHAESGLLKLHSSCSLYGGPRHLCYGQHAAYVCHELSNEVTVLSVQNGTFKPVQRLSCLPADFSGTSAAAAIRLSPDCTRLLVSNRGHGTCTVFEIENSGLLKAPQWIPCGEFTRDLHILPSGSLLAADQHAGVYHLDPNGYTRGFFPAQAAVCIASPEF